MFAATAGAGPSSAPQPPTTVEIAAAEAEQDASGGAEEGNEWRPRPRSAIAGGGTGQGSGEEIGSLFPLSGTVAGLVTIPKGYNEELSQLKVTTVFDWRPTRQGQGAASPEDPFSFRSINHYEGDFEKMNEDLQKVNWQELAELCHQEEDDDGTQFMDLLRLTVLQMALKHCPKPIQRNTLKLRSNVGPLRNSNNDLENNPKVMADILQRQYVSVFSDPSNPNLKDTTEQLTPPSCSISDQVFRTDDIIKAIDEIGNCKLLEELPFTNSYNFDYQTPAGFSLKPKASVRDLGITLDSNYHCDSICGSCELWRCVTSLALCHCMGLEFGRGWPRHLRISSCGPLGEESSAGDT
ncbi:unnamed protein product [Gadus morhua 'NCC']